MVKLMENEGMVSKKNASWMASNTGLGGSVVELLGRRTHDSRSRVRLPVMTLPGYLFLRQVTVFGG